MATLTTKYSVGDVVYYATTHTESKKHPCPDCNGLRKWKATSPAGSEYEFDCPRCAKNYLADSGLRLDYQSHTPSSRRLTIGSIQVDTAPDSYAFGNRYMCLETGVGSGSIYQESNLFETEAEALAAATIEADEKNKSVDWVVQLYNKSLDISDYQLDNAKIKLASDAELKSRAFLWNIEELLEAIEEASDKEAILEAVQDYKSYGFKRDMQAIGKPLPADASAEKVPA